MRNALQAIVACHCQRVAPTITTIFEIIALAAPLIKTSADAHPAVASSEEEATHSAPHSSSSSQHHRLPHVPGTAAVGVPAAPVRFLLLLSLRLARGWAPAVVVAQGVRLVGNVVQQRENKDNKVGREGTEVRALQLGLSVVPRVDPRASRSLADYCQIYREWLLLLRGRLAQSGVESPEGLFDEGEEGDEELMRFALCYNILQARSLKDALVAMDRALINIKEFAAWYKKYPFISPADLTAWQRISWWEGPDDEGHLWLMIDFRAAVSASRTHGPEMVARVLVSNMEYGVRQLIPELGCAGTLRVVVDTSGVNIGAVLRMRGVFQKMGHVMDRMYPCRLQVLYMVGLPFPLRWAFRASMQLLHVHTRRKIRMCKVTDVPRRLPSQLRSHKLSVQAGLNDWGDLIDETGSFWEGGREGSGPAPEGGIAGPSSLDPDLADVYPSTPLTPLTRGLSGSGVVNRRGWRRWRRGTRAVAAGDPADVIAPVYGKRGRKVAARVAVYSMLVLLAGLLVVYLLVLQRTMAWPEEPFEAIGQQLQRVFRWTSSHGHTGGAV
eukprot:GHUV01026175.1.p1 GENE.GHUV01026175.1~~GHUV01026175.1.p1  ORF type:complete len:553 (+),score=146.41 GHUV01026175.1:244-1902(+)